MVRFSPTAESIMPENASPTAPPLESLDAQLCALLLGLVIGCSLVLAFVPIGRSEYDQLHEDAQESCYGRVVVNQYLSRNDKVTYGAYARLRIQLALMGNEAARRSEHANARGEGSGCEDFPGT